jgi:DNA-directed RNA polymerase subunit RPC12/RpoP
MPMTVKKKMTGKKTKGKPHETGAVELICLKCKRTEIHYLPTEEILRCPDCNVRMVIREILREGKSY